MKRSLLLAMLLQSVAGAALAADLDAIPLRGPILESPAAATSWDGFYFGGHGGYGDANLDLTRLGQNQVAYILRNSTILTEQRPDTWLTTKARDGRAATYGGFVGYNYQLDDAVVGLEADYTRTSIQATSGDSLTRRFVLSDTNTYDLTVSSAAKAKLTDYGTIRGRLGYAFGDLLPFLTAGVAGGRFQTASTSTVSGFVSNPSSTPPLPRSAINFGTNTQTDSNSDNFKFGYTLGAGADYSFTPNVFLRAEYQFVRFDFGKTDLHVARAGVGVHF